MIFHRNPDTSVPIEYIKIADIVAAVSHFYEIDPVTLLSHRRTANVVLPRQIAMYLAKNLTGYSLPKIGFFMRKRDHTTVLHAVRKVESLRRVDAVIDRDITTIERTLKSEYDAKADTPPSAQLPASLEPLPSTTHPEGGGSPISSGVS